MISCAFYSIKSRFLWDDLFWILKFQDSFSFERLQFVHIIKRKPLHSLWIQLFIHLYVISLYFFIVIGWPFAYHNIIFFSSNQMTFTYIIILWIFSWQLLQVIVSFLIQFIYSLVYFHLFIIQNVLTCITFTHIVKMYF